MLPAFEASRVMFPGTDEEGRTGGAGTDSSSASTDVKTVVAVAIKAVGADRGRLMDIVQAVHQRLGHLPDAAIAAIAAGLAMHPVEVEDMVSFYALPSRTPKGRFHIRLSNTPVSQMKGAGAVARAFADVLGVEMGETSPDGEFTLEWTSDIGMSDQEPAALINGVVVTALVPTDAAGIVETLRRGGTVNTRPPLFPGFDGHEPVTLPQARVASSLVRAGPVLFCRSSRGAGVRAALTLAPEAVIQRITRAGLRGRGGAGFPTGLKWKLCRQSKSETHYIICNADEGETGTFKDRVLLSEIPDAVFDGMTVAGYALGAHDGILYLRGEYAYLWNALQAALANRRRLGLLGQNICGHEGFDFDIRIQLGAGAYICGEESALIESMEGKRGAPRDKPPFPTDRGYLGSPTAVNNVESLACVARIMEKGPEWFAGYGTAESAGTKLLSVSGDCAHPGVYELPFGITVNELLDLVGAPETAFVQMSGPSGQTLAPKDFGRRIAFEDLPSAGSVMVFGPERDVLDVTLQFADFFINESCGWCTPCRVGTTLLKKNLEKIVNGRGTLADITALETLARTVSRTSRCGLGQTAPNPVLTTMRNFPEAYEARLQSQSFLPSVTLNEALAEAVVIQGREPVAGEPKS